MQPSARVAHRLNSAVPNYTPPSTLCGTVKRIAAFDPSNNKKLSYRRETRAMLCIS